MRRDPVKVFAISAYVVAGLFIVLEASRLLNGGSLDAEYGMLIGIFLSLGTLAEAVRSELVRLERKFEVPPASPHVSDETEHR